MITFDQDERDLALASIKVVGVGGAGGNTINCMIDSQYKGVEFIAINTDAQALKNSKAQHTIQIGQKSTKGLGAGANPEVGKRSAEEDIDKVLELLHDADIVFVAGGMGGGTGSGALPVIVKALKEKGILTIVILTKPFAFEGKKRARVADEAIEEVKKYADTLLVVPNQKLLDLVDDQVSMIDGFGMINEVLNHSVRGIADIITRAGHINVDFADVKEIMKDRGLAVMGTARASGESRAKKATLQAISSPLLENMNIAGARGVLLNITGGPDLGLHEISQAASIIYEQADQDANIILGSVIDRDMKDEISVTVIATGFLPTAKETVAQQVQQTLVQPVVAAPVNAPQPQVQVVVKEVIAQPVEVVAPVQYTAPVQPALVAPVVAVQPQVQVIKEVVVQPVIEVAVPLQQVVAPVIMQAAVPVAPVVEAIAPVAIVQPTIIQPAVQVNEPAQPTSCDVPHIEQPVSAGESCKLETAAVQQVQEVVVPVVVQKEHVGASGLPTPTGAINVQDLDIPTFMSKQYQQQKPKND